MNKEEFICKVLKHAQRVVESYDREIEQLRGVEQSDAKRDELITEWAHWKVICDDLQEGRIPACWANFLRGVEFDGE